MKKFFSWLIGNGSVTLTSWLAQEEKREDRISFVLRLAFAILSTLALFVAWIFSVHAPESMPLVRQILSAMGWLGEVIGISATAVVWIIHVIMLFLLMAGKSMKVKSYLWTLIVLWLGGIIFYSRLFLLGPIVLFLNALIILVVIYLDLNDVKKEKK